MSMRLWTAAMLAFAAFASADARALPGSGTFVIAAEDTATSSEDQSGEESAKMGKEEGTHKGDDQGAEEDSDTDKVEQPERPDAPADGSEQQQ